MANIPSLLEMLQAGVHFGHRESRWHPKMKEYIFGARGGVHIHDLEKTQAKLEEALTYVRDLVARGGIILFLGTKRQAQDIVKKYAEECGMPYVSGRWLGGTLTNNAAVMNLVRHYNDLKAKQASGALAKYTKKEQSVFGKEIDDLEKKVGGIKNIVRPPDAIYVVDLMKEKTAVAEAVTKRIPIVGMTDTNVNPELAAYPIPANDDSIKSIELITKLIAEAVKEGKGMRESRVAAETKAKEAAAATPVGV